MLQLKIFEKFLCENSRLFPISIPFSDILFLFPYISIFLFLLQTPVTLFVSLIFFLYISFSFPPSLSLFLYSSLMIHKTTDLSKYIKNRWTTKCQLLYSAKRRIKKLLNPEYFTQEEARKEPLAKSSDDTRRRHCSSCSNSRECYTPARDLQFLAYSYMRVESIYRNSYTHALLYASGNARTSHLNTPYNCVSRANVIEVYLY